MDQPSLINAQQDALKACINYLRFLLIGGLGIVLFGMAFAVVLPAAQLDVVLTPEQLRDDQTAKIVTSALRVASNGWQRLFCMVGLAVSVVSYLGLRAARRADESNSDAAVPE